ncbi:SpaA isopeptide-forming pilin-related protein [Listeria grayi]|uniref:SpaA isopeptide-forming pilin-related protein n=1 Tax=Listeria grayi TaxID=1641 RepID=UPI00162342F1|nr:SpaA isopeptide-forming pilin-related protein [Listeria grayi]MBC1921513.1 isopeptide-forming domain-containing fimbrial protein [Listeria grayi]
MYKQNLIKRIAFGLLAFLLTFSSPISFLSSAGTVNAAPKAAGDGNVHVTPANFLDYFTLNGTSTYDSSTGIVTLTENVKNQSGNFALNTKIDMSKNFSLKGKINLGNKSNIQGGADGIGFAFHAGSPSDIGTNGGALGIGGLTNGFGWKADSHYNFEGGTNYVKDPDEFATPIAPDTSTPSFGSFVYNDANKTAHSYEGSDAPAQVIGQPTNDQFKDIEINYDGTSKVMTISYDGKTWSKNISSWNSGTALAFIVSASTGNKFNLQQFQITSFDYVTSGKVTVKYIDIDTGNALADDITMEGSINDNYTTEQKAFDGYTFVKVDGNKTGVYQEQEQQVIYYYQKIPPVGTVEVTKVDKDDPSKVLSGAEFKLLNDAGQVVKEDITTNADGKLKIADLPLGKYSLVETKAPTGYELDATPLKFEITDAGSAATLELTKENAAMKGSVDLKKVDSDNPAKVLQGAVFKLVDGDGKTLQEDLTTNTNGEVKVADLPLGSYSLIETKAPIGYILDNTPVNFTITEANHNTTISLTKDNTAMKGSVLLTKVDSADPAKTLQGAEFKLVDNDGKTLRENLTTNASGELKVNDLLLGSYSLVETKAPTGYILDDSPVKFTITADNYDTTIDLNKENTEMKGSVQLTKVDSQDAAKTLQGAEFKLVDNDGKTLRENLTTNADGILKINDLALGSYSLVETKAPTGYILDDSPVKFTITADNYDTTIDLNKENTEMKGSVQLTKVDSQDAAKTLQGAEFKLTDADGKTLRENLTTNADGILKVSDLALGSYNLVETKAPTGYILDDSPVKFTITADNYDTTIDLTKANTEMKGSVQLTKVDSMDPAKTLQGAEFKLIDKDGLSVKEGLTTDKEGKLAVKDLSLGSYSLVETKAPSGYQLDQSPVNFSITADNYTQTIQLTKENNLLPPKYGSVELTKIDRDKPSTTLQGAVFKLVDADGKTLQKGLMTNKAGKLKITDLALGSYSLVETKAPTGYQLDAAPINFKITDSNYDSTIKVKKTNKLLPADKASVLLTKVDSANTKKTLQGATFKLLNADGKTIKSNLKTNQNGNILVKDLTPGKYSFVETKAPAGYKLSKKAIPFQVKANSTKLLQLTAKNTKADPPVITKNIDGKSHVTLKNRNQSFNWNIHATFGNATSSWEVASIQDKVNKVLDIEKVTIVDENGHNVKANGRLDIKNNVVTFAISKKNGSFAYLSGHSYTMTITTKIKSSVSDKALIQASKENGIPNIADLTYKDGKTTIHSNDPSVTPRLHDGSLPHTGDSNPIIWVLVGLFAIVGAIFFILSGKRKEKH